MSPDHLASLLAAGAAANSTRSPACPDEHQIAGYVDSGLDEASRKQVELHLAQCSGCLALVGLLCRERDASATETVACDDAAQTRAFVNKASQRRWRFAPQWAAAAALVLAMPLLLQLGRNLDRGAEGQGRPDPVTTRTLASTGAGLQVLFPSAGSAVDPRRMSFRWTAVSGTPYYDVRIVTDAGDVVVQQRVTGTTWRAPAQLNLHPGAEYFVHIDAYPSADKAVSSDHVPFRVAD
jgi:anti-sigma factor RsiW